MSNEKEFLDMCDDFKNRIKEKNEEIANLKKFIISLYGLIKYADEHSDLHLIELTRGVISIQVSELLGIDAEDLHYN